MQRTNRTPVLVLAALLSLAYAAVAQEAPAATYVIRTINFEIEGKTKDFIMLGKLDIKLGKSFEDREALEAFIEDKRQTLSNERVLESVEADYTATLADDGSYDVALLFRTKDSWNLIALPKFDYSSNSGLELSIRARDYNFLGSMERLALNLNYEHDENGRNGYGIGTSFTWPFLALEHEWALGLSQDFTYYPDETPTTATGSAGLSVTFRELGFPITLSASQGISKNPEGIQTDPDDFYLTTGTSASASIPTGIVLGDLGSLNYGPSVSYSHNWGLYGDLLYADRNGSTLGTSHGLSAGRVDWIGNMRTGFSGSLSNSYSFYMPDERLSVYLDASAYAHSNWRGRIGVDSRLVAYYRVTGSERTDQGGPMRGIRDARLDGDVAAFLNLDFPIKLFDFPTHVIIKKDWLDFELQFSPFLDLGVVRRTDADFGADDIWYAGGFEFLVFPKLMRSFIVRGSLGFDLAAVLENKSLTAPSSRDGASPYEISIGLGLHY